MADNDQERALSAEAIVEWNGHVESVLRGIAHALNNRAAALSALMELTSEPPEDPPVIRSILGTELDRVQSLVGVLRSVATRRGAVEAFTPGDAAAEAAAVLDVVTELRDMTLQFDVQRAEPVRVARWMFVRSLIALGAGISRPSGAQESRIMLSAGDEWLEVSASDTGQRPSLLVSELASAMGGEVFADRYGFRIPTLAALRRREGR
jgi:hypothetical protein